MNVLVIEHEADSGASMLGERFVERGYELDVRVPLDGTLPATADGYDAVLTLGSASCVNDDGIDEWFGPHLQVLRDADARGVPIFGVCFGAQAMAVALGGSVQRAATPEVGWYTIRSQDPDFIEEGPWLEWHIDAVTPPPTATVLASSDVCVQAYTVGRHLAVQFHPEVTTAEVAEWVKGDPGGPPSAGTDGASILARFDDEFPAARERAHRLVDRFLTHAGLA